MTSRTFRSIVLLAASVGPACRAARVPLPPSPPPLIRTEAVAPPSPGPPTPVAELTPSVRTLDNGLQIKRVSHSGARFAAAFLAFETPGDVRNEWLAELVARTIASFVNDETPLSVVAGVVHAVDRYGVIIRCLPEALPNALDRLSFAVRGAALEMPRLRRELTAMGQKMAAEFEDTTSISANVIYQMRYGDTHPWSRDAFKTLNDMASFTGHDVARFSEGALRPGRAQLSIVAPEYALARVDVASFAAWRAGRIPSAKASPPPPPPRTDDVHRIGLLGSSSWLAALTIMHLGPPPSDPDYPAFAALCQEIGGFWGALNRTYRHLRGATYGLSSNIVKRSTVSECFLRGFVDNGSVIRLMDDHRQQLEAMHDQQSTGAMTERVQQNRRVRTARRLEDPAAVARWLVQVSPTEAAARELTDEQLQAVARRYFRARGWDIAVATRSRSLVERLKQRGQVRVFGVRFNQRRP